MIKIFNFRFLILNLKQKQRGFTLIELLVVIGIIGILSGLLFSNFVGVRQSSRDGVRKSDLRQIQAALELYRADQGSYPGALPACNASLKDPLNTVTYMQKTPCDPTNGTTSYTYNSPSGNTTYSLVACLENKNDSQRDKDAALPNPNPCDQSANFAYTLQNP